MNLPNVLTVSRLGFAAVIMALLASTLQYATSGALVAFAMAGVTDYLDGHIARRRNIISAFGRLMDPLTDKILVCAVFVSFVEIQLNGHALVPAWLVVIIISREFLVTGLRLLAANRGNVISAGKWGKHKTVWQIVAIIVLLLGLAIHRDVLPWAAPNLQAQFDMAFVYIALTVSVAVALITVASGLLYFLQHRDLIVRG